MSSKGKLRVLSPNRKRKADKPMAGQKNMTNYFLPKKKQKDLQKPMAGQKKLPVLSPNKKHQHEQKMAPKRPEDGKSPDMSHRPTRVSKTQFLDNLEKKMFRGKVENYKKTNCKFDVEKKQIDQIFKLLHDTCNSLYDKQDSQFWNWTPEEEFKHNESGVYFGVKQNGDTKFGSSSCIRDRTDIQKLKSSMTVMTLETIKKALPPNLVGEIKKVGMPALQFHPEQDEKLTKLILLQCGEGIIGCAYENNCSIFFEKLVQMPSPKVREVIQMERMIQCHEYAIHKNLCGDAMIPAMIPKELIEFFAGIPIRGAFQMYSDITLKSQNLESKSDFAQAQRALPKDGGFVTNHMAQQRCGSTFGGYTNAVKIAPAADFIDKHCLKKLRPLLKQEDLDNDEVKGALAPIMASNDFHPYYVQPDPKKFGRGTKEILEGFLWNKEALMLQTQTNNIEALQAHAPKWFEEQFDMTSQQKKYRSTFLKSKDGTKRLVVHAAHFLVFAHTTALKTRFTHAEDFCLHQDLMIANNCPDFSKARDFRLRLQCFLMEMDKNGEGDSKTTSFHFARNNAFSPEWFKSSLPRIKATSDALDLHEQTFIYVRDRIGRIDMRRVIECFGLMQGNAAEQLAPYELSARCYGTPKFGNIEKKACVADENEQTYLCYAGARSENHALPGYSLCNRCLENNKRNLNREHWILTRQYDKVVDDYKRRNEDSKRYNKKHPVNVQASRNKSNEKRVLDPEKQKGRILYQKNRDAKQKQENGPKKSGTSRAKRSETFRYDDELRKKMKRAICICAIINGSESLLYNNTLITVLDKVREDNPELDKAYKKKEDYNKPEYTRCISVFLEPFAGEAKQNKMWVPNEKLKQIETSFKSGNNLSNIELIEKVAVVCSDEKQMIKEKDQADECPFD